MKEKTRSRRDFLHLASKMTSVSIAAFSFGCSIKPSIEKNSTKTALLYGTRYGATKDTAQWIAKGAGDNLDILDIETVDLNTIADRYDMFIIGSGVWIDGVHIRMKELLSAKTNQIEPKIIAAFIVCGTTGKDKAGKKRIEGYFDRFFQPLNNRPPRLAYFGGRMNISKLSEKDRKLLENFYRNILKREFKDWDRTDPKAAKSFGAKISQTAIS
ncbi:MAG: hypothetical protein B5M52_07410 [Helicobacteraceae bacterium 4484_230]|nr:MAG: hypothetical protein B5M52_07410 [Helicobacteraceae bacterium 4484_230]